MRSLSNLPPGVTDQMIEDYQDDSVPSTPAPSQSARERAERIADRVMTVFMSVDIDAVPSRNEVVDAIAAELGEQK